MRFRPAAGALIRHLPKNEQLRRLCKAYVDHVVGENNDDPVSNGELDFAKAVLPLCAVVVDCGANVGDWSALALQANSDLTIHQFEPSEATYQTLTAHVWPRSAHVVANNCALGAAIGEAELFVFGAAQGTNSLYRRVGLEDGWGLSVQTTERVRLETLDNYAEHAGLAAIDFLKVDVEGHELEVFKGASRLLTNHAIRYVQFEYGGCNIDSRTLLKDFFEFFLERAYDLYKILPGQRQLVRRYDQRLENFHYQNWVATPRGTSPR